jgi:hypothetical protein
MDKTFEELFKELLSDLVDVCVEYAEDQAEKIYLYATWWEGKAFFDVFYKLDGAIFRKDALHCSGRVFQHEANPAIQAEVVHRGIQTLEELNLRCRDYFMEMPIEIRLIYDAETNAMSGQYIYEEGKEGPRWTNPEAAFDDWIKSLDQTRNNG